MACRPDGQRPPGKLLAEKIAIERNRRNLMERKQKKFVIGVLIAAVLCLGIVYFFATRVPDPYSGINIEEYVKVADYTKVEAKTTKVKVTEKEVQQEIDRRLDAKKTSKNVKSGVVKNGDTVNIDYVGSIDGVKFEGGEEKGRDLEIGSHTFIPGFEEGLIGAKVGTTTNVKVRFPDDYMQPDLAGKNAIFAVKINSMEQVTIPPLDNDFVTANSDVSTVAEYKKLVEQEVLAQKEEAYNLNEMNKMWTKFIDKCKIKKDENGKELYPEEQLQTLIEDTKAFYEEVASNNNVSVEDYAKQMFGLDKATFDEQIKEYAKIMIKEQMVVYYIAEKEGIEVSRDEYDQYVEDTLKGYGYTADSFKEANSGKSYEEIEGKEKVRFEALKAATEKKLLEIGQDNYKKAQQEKAEKVKKEKERKEKLEKEKAKKQKEKNKNKNKSKNKDDK